MTIDDAEELDLVMSTNNFLIIAQIVLTRPLVYEFIPKMKFH